MSYKLTKKRLLFDLYKAFESAKKNKGNKPCIKIFESNLHNNLMTLCDELWGRKYKAQPSTCFIITHPKQREVFAAAFRDRIVHHLYYNYVHILYERTFIQDSYSCIKNRGTHYGIHRLEKHIRQETKNYNETAYALKMDICGYFMSMDRLILLKIANDTLKKMKYHKINKYNKITWDDILDFDFINYLTKEIILLDPTIDCIFRSQKIEWIGLPKSKSLFHTNKDCGLPIGNLTSQLFSNVYMNVFDQFIKRVLKCKHYGRYVDDAFIVSNDKQFLLSIIPQVKEFLESNLHLILHMGKTHIINCYYGIEFLGVYIKPFRTYISNACLKRIKTALETFKYLTIASNAQSSINSFLGILKHYSTYNLRVELFIPLLSLYQIGCFNDSITKFMIKLGKNTHCL